MAKFQKLEAGKPLEIHAETFNTMVDASKLVMRDGRHTGAGQPSTKPLEPSRVRIVNATGEDRQRMDIVGVRMPAVTPTKNQAQWQREILPLGETPNELLHYGRWAVLLEPIKDGGVGLAIVDGDVPCLVSISDPSHQFCDVDHENTSALKSCLYGSGQIIWRQQPGQRGTMPCIVRIGNAPPRIYALDDCWVDRNKPRLPTRYVTNDLLQEAIEGQIILADDTCWRVRVASCDELACLDAECITVDRRYDDCDRCKSCWKLIECVDEGTPEEIITTTDLADYEGRVVKISGYTQCWEVEHYGHCPPSDTRDVRVIQDYDECAACACYTIYRCGRGTFRVVTNDLLAEAQAAGLNVETPEDLADPLGQGPAFLVDGDCWYVDSFGECDSTAEQVQIDAVYEGCGACSCLRLTQCDDANNIRYVTSAVDTDGDPLDLRDYIGQVVRLDDGNCYTIEMATDPEDCEEAEEDVAVLEAYADCAACKCYTLYECGSGEPGTTVATYTDLEGLGYSIGDIFRVTSPSETCYEIVDDEASCSGAIGVAPIGRYPDCDACAHAYRYRLSDVCDYLDCDTGTSSSSQSRHADVYTDEHLAAAVGQYIHADGRCWLVESVSPETPVTGGWEAPIQWSGPYASCAACTDTPVTEVIERERTWHDGTYLVRDVWLEHYVGGVLTKRCPPTTQILCECTPPTCYELTRCHSDDVLYTQSDLSGYQLGDVLKRDGEDGDYWTLTDSGVNCGYPIETFNVDGEPLEECPAAATCVQLVLCGTENHPEPNYLYTAAGNLTAPDDDPATVHERDAEEGGGRWKVVSLSASCDQQTSFTEVATHAACDDTFVALELCDDDQTTTVANAADLTSPEVGSVHKDDSGDCWIVTAVDVAGPGSAFDEAANFPAGVDPCGDCDVPETFYQLQQCNGGNFLPRVSSNSLTNPVVPDMEMGTPGSVHRGFDNICYEVVGTTTPGTPTPFEEWANFAPDANACNDCANLQECHACGDGPRYGAAVWPFGATIKHPSNLSGEQVQVSSTGGVHQTSTAVNGFCEPDPPNQIMYELMFELFCDSGTWKCRAIQQGQQVGLVTASDDGNGNISATFPSATACGNVEITFHLQACPY